MSVSNILVGSPATLNPDLVPSGVVVDSVNGVVGAVTLSGGTGISVNAPVGQDISLSVLAASTSTAFTLFKTDNTGAVVAGAPFTAPTTGYYAVRTVVVSQDYGVGYAWVNGTNQVWSDLTITVPFQPPYVEQFGSWNLSYLVSEAAPGFSEVCSTNLIYLPQNAVVAANAQVVGPAISIAANGVDGYIWQTICPLFAA